MEGATQDVGERAAFTGHSGEFFRLALVGNLLLIPTFGFYRFWLTTDVRRHLWSHTLIGGDALEYTGRARELLIGFLIALAILTPIYIAYFLLGIEAELWQAFASIPLFLIIYMLAYYGSYRARRYRASRTTFRGIRLWMTGSGWRFAWRAMLWDMLTLISLGLALPWRAAALEQYKMRHTQFGDLQAGFAGTGGGLFKRGWWLWLLFLLWPLSVPWAFFASYGVQHLGMPEIAASMAGLPVALLTLLMVFVYPLFRAIEMRWWLEGIRFGDMTLASDLRKRSVLWCYIKAAAVGLFAIIIGSGIVAAFLLDGSGDVNFDEENFNPFFLSPETIAPAIAGYLVMLIGLGVAMLHFVTRGIWRAATESVTVFNLDALDGVVARGAAAGSLGEGLADALDFGAGGV